MADATLIPSEIRQIVDRAKVYQVEANGCLVNLGDLLAALYRVEEAARIMSAGAPRSRRKNSMGKAMVAWSHLGELRDALDALVVAELGQEA
jgi:hypothetical protein